MLIQVDDGAGGNNAAQSRPRGGGRRSCGGGDPPQSDDDSVTSEGSTLSTLSCESTQSKVCSNREIIIKWVSKVHFEC